MLNLYPSFWLWFLKNLKNALIEPESLVLCMTWPLNHVSEQWLVAWRNKRVIRGLERPVPDFCRGERRLRAGTDIKGLQGNQSCLCNKAIKEKKKPKRIRFRKHPGCWVGRDWKRKAHASFFSHTFPWSFYFLSKCF